MDVLPRNDLSREKSGELTKRVVVGDRGGRETRTRGTTGREKGNAMEKGAVDIRLGVLVLVISGATQR